MCEPIAFQGTFLGTRSPTRPALRVPIGQGLTGLGRRERPIAPARRRRRRTRAASSSAIRAAPESILIVPMTVEDIVHGLVVVSAIGRDRFDADDETTLTIFAA